MKYRLLIIAACLFTTQSIAQQGFSTIEERMTGKEFSETGLDKLSDSELNALNDWLRSHSVATLENANSQGTVSDARGFEGDPRGGYDDSTIVSRIVGDFTGWDGETVFTLENGMVWKQAESGRFYSGKLTNPVVSIEKGLFSSWSMKVEGYNREVRVDRIQ